MAKILVVDDDPVTLKFLESILRQNGYEVSTAVDGLDALAKVKNDVPDLVVLDVMMPEINGYDVCYQVRFNDDFAKMPILLTTSRENELPPEIGEQLNIDYLQKPVNTELFLSKVRTLLIQS